MNILNTLLIAATLAVPTYSMEDDPYRPENPKIVTGLDLSFGNLQYILKDLDVVKSYPNLTHLNLDGQKRLTSLQGIEHLTKLRKLDLTFCQRLEDISTLAALASLERLNARHIAAKDFSFLSKLPKLHTLTVSTSHVLPYTFSTLTNLSTLVLEGHWDRTERNQLQTALPRVKVVFEPYL